MVVKLRKLLGHPDPNYPRPPLEEGEESSSKESVFSR